MISPPKLCQMIILYKNLSDQIFVIKIPSHQYYNIFENGITRKQLVIELNKCGAGYSKLRFIVISRKDTKVMKSFIKHNFLFNWFHFYPIRNYLRHEVDQESRLTGCDDIIYKNKRRFQMLRSVLTGDLENSIITEQ